MTGSNGFRGSALFVNRAGAQAPGTFATGSERVPTGSNGFRGNTLCVIRAGAQAPGTFTTGSERVPTGSEAITLAKAAAQFAIASQMNFASTMTSESLEFWTSGRKGNLSRKSQAQVWTLTHVSELRGLQLTQGETHGGYNKSTRGTTPKHGKFEILLRDSWGTPFWEPFFRS